MDLVDLGHLTIRSNLDIIYNRGENHFNIDKFTLCLVTEGKE